MTTRFHTDILNETVEAWVVNVDKGTTDPTGKIEFYTGTPPAALDDAPGATLLASVDYQDPAFSAGGAGELDPGEAEALGVPLATTGLDDGDIGWARILDRDGTARWDEDNVGTTAEFRITVNTLTVSTGVDFNVTSHIASVVSQSDFD